LEKGADAYWYRDFVDGFTVIPANKLPPGVKWGTTITSFAIDAPKYLTYLQDRILNLGGTITRATLPAGEGLVGMLKASQDVLKPSTQSVYAYVNATGLGAYALLGDEKMFPLRTQTVHIKGESANIVDRLEDGNLISYENPISGAVPITYVTPRVGQGFTVLVRLIFRSGLENFSHNPKEHISHCIIALWAEIRH
jgi:D-amino-acid oxidase